MEGSGPNKALQAYWEKKHSPTPPQTGLPRDERPLSYAKDVQGTVLMKNRNLRMAYRAPDDPVPRTGRPEVVLGRLKSDITTGFEKIYERSYH
ncbi:hypothetical protein AB1Y20_011438 [Prymnesium parvum]|uniref:Uncharacterized protein n=1 Tax=Prymnesium parvum TaxID=97485 RepID=A0AB34IPJ7_PRYPA